MNYLIALLVLALVVIIGLCLKVRSELTRERDRVAADEQRLINELRATDRAKNEFISTVSHELRTPLTSIIGYLEVLRDGSGGDMSPAQESMLEIIDRNSQRLLELINDVLVLSRIESGAYATEHVPVSVVGLAAETQRALLPMAMDKSLQYNVEVSADVGDVVGDRSQLERMLFNLTSNAMKFTSEGGMVCISARRSSGAVEISVTDNGTGIPEKEQQHLFDRFYRATAAHENAVQGTGLGLAIVKSIVELHGASISVDSKPGEGTVFTVLFPGE